MSKEYTSWGIAARIWMGSSGVFALGSLIFLLFDDLSAAPYSLLIGMAALIGSMPVVIILVVVLKYLMWCENTLSLRVTKLIVSCFFIAMIYGVLGGLIDSVLFSVTFFKTTGIITLILFGTSLLTLGIFAKSVKSYLSSDEHLTKQLYKMETSNNSASSTNPIFIKGLITLGLILLLMIPTVFVSNLVKERETRHKEVAIEVSDKWSRQQTLSGPFLYVPYKYVAKDSQGKEYEETSYFRLLPDQLDVSGNIDHQVRLRSIYKVLLYRAALNNKGEFKLSIPDVQGEGQILWKDAKVCYIVSDFKGIEERLLVNINGATVELSPGLPYNELDAIGLSASIDLSDSRVGDVIPFELKVKIKGSEKLHFIPLAGNSSYTLHSAWPNPSFDGNNLPADRRVSDSGFDAKWVFNKANLPFGTLVTNYSFDMHELAFGVTMVQPADQYAKTERSVKYAILIIGLTFCLFFIVEIMQKKAIHPVQYVLIGLALVIFYTLLLSISEFIFFDGAYAIAALSVIMLITLYAKSHFRSWRSGGIFGTVLTLLFGFIFVLIRLEDTALLVGSVGLFIILAIAMYASRNINWYGKTPSAEII